MTDVVNFEAEAHRIEVRLEGETVGYPRNRWRSWTISGPSMSILVMYLRKVSWLAGNYPEIPDSSQGIAVAKNFNWPRLEPSIGRWGHPDGSER